MNEILADKARILIVDDEPVNLKLLDKLLGSQGYRQLIKIQDSRETLAAYCEARPDLILLDINMPYLDGYQVMQQLQSLNDPLLPPIIILTAQPRHDHFLKALTLGARDFIGKPFDREELLMRVRNLLEAQLAKRMLHDHNHVLEEMVRARTDELQRTRLQIVRRLGRASEYRDTETGTHIIRMSKVSVVLARHCGWGNDDCDSMLLASSMHDVGKIGVPDAILLKPGKLDGDEWQIMKKHALIGADILKDDESELLQLAHAIALSHHERWDGSGYPYGLAGDAIPLAGRIVAVADVFDALTSPRPYKEPWVFEKAVAYILDNAGTQFDPKAARCFESCLPEIRSVYGDSTELVG